MPATMKRHALGLDRIAALPPEPYATGPTITGKTQVKLVPPEQIDALCRAAFANASTALGLKLTVSADGRYRECYDIVNDVVLVPKYPSKAEQKRLFEHGMGHARGGTHEPGLGHGLWWDAPWKTRNIFAQGPVNPPAVQTENIFRKR
ncbi:hypothetical protein [Phenylobacterium deserti]|uniref:Uncharacterized protein n=1 Tax=Phenylobacterium deserti TaxID=1914756 RepID=A0A328AC02_9CAUL|nr:hypothetical protein [Phenylobacterium deserti]RAK52135.1 hypothetical protein DJ018_13345 [Phenylobacterium deserti]